MFDLEKAIADWRRQMLAAGIKNPATLEELESHLREDVERQIRSGIDAQQAFRIAAKEIGQAPELKMEFKKVNAPIETQFVKLAGIACVTVALLFSLWTLLFLFNHEISLMAKIFGLAAVAATVSSWSYNHKILPVIHNQLVRTAIGFACCLGGLVWIRLFTTSFLPRMMLHPAGMEVPAGQLMVVFLWGWTVMAVLAGIGHGLEEAAGRRNSMKGF